MGSARAVVFADIVLCVDSVVFGRLGKFNVQCGPSFVFWHALHITSHVSARRGQNHQNQV